MGSCSLAETEGKYLTNGEGCTLTRTADIDQ